MAHKTHRCARSGCEPGQRAGRHGTAVSATCRAPQGRNRGGCSPSSPVARLAPSPASPASCDRRACRGALVTPPAAIGAAVPQRCPVVLLVRRRRLTPGRRESDRRPRTGPEARRGSRRHGGVRHRPRDSAWLRRANSLTSYARCAGEAEAGEAAGQEDDGPQIEADLSVHEPKRATRPAVRAGTYALGNRPARGRMFDRLEKQAIRHPES